MAALLDEYIDETATPSAPREVLPPGRYLAQIVESDVTQAKSGNGTKLELTFSVVDGPHAGCKVWASLNIVHVNPQAQEIAQREFAAIRQAVNVARPRSSEELHHKPMIITVAVELAGTTRGTYVAKSDRNVIKGFEAASGQAPAPIPPPRPAAAPVASAPPAAARPAAMPWKR